MHSFTKSVIFCLMVLTVSSYGDSQTLVNKNNQSVSANQLPAETKDTDIPSGKYKDMYCASNNVFIYLSTDLNSSISSNDQLMKYDRVRMFEVKDNWAKVVLTSATPDMKRTSGWVSRGALDEWVTAKFFKTRDNIFLNNLPIFIYDKPYMPVDSLGKYLSQASIDTLSSNESYRVLKGNGERFYIISEAGKSGWVSKNNIPINQLIAKNVQIEKQNTTELPTTTNYAFINNDPDNKTIRFSIPNRLSVDRYLLKGDIDNVLLTGIVKVSLPEIIKKHPTARKDNTLLRKNAKTVILEDRLGYCFNSIYSEYGDIPIITNLNGKKYNLYRYKVINFYGMIAVFEVYKPFELSELEKRVVENENYSATYDYYMNNINKIIMKNNWVQRTKIKLYSYDTSLKMIKELWLEGNCHIEAGIEHLGDNPFNQIDYNFNNLKIKFTTVDGVISSIPYINDYNGPVWKGFLRGKVPKRDVVINISKEELENANTSMKDVYDNWNVYIQAKLFSDIGSVIDYKMFINKQIDINGIKLDYKNDNNEYFYVNTSGKGNNIYNTNININILSGFYKTNKQRGGLILFVNKEMEVIKVIKIDGVVGADIIGVNDNNIVFGTFRNSGNYTIRILNGIICEY